MEIVPAAQYLRMSTEHQEYSISNQSNTIACYASAHGFEVVKSYSDPGESGLSLARRHGLQSLLRDVICGTAPYKVVLVRDVSRWGRFQDTDEAAHYEFLCKKAGVTVHYCAEVFQNDDTIYAQLLKSMKRCMAAEYSRELGAKVFESKKRLHNWASVLEGKQDMDSDDR
jgi:DNA invertase Pin-like site-specific DNA recombinase